MPTFRSIFFVLFNFYIGFLPSERRVAENKIYLMKVNTLFLCGFVQYILFHFLIVKNEIKYTEKRYTLFQSYVKTKALFQWCSRVVFGKCVAWKYSVIAKWEQWNCFLYFIGMEMSSKLLWSITGKHCYRLNRKTNSTTIYLHLHA